MTVQTAAGMVRTMCNYYDRHRDLPNLQAIFPLSRAAKYGAAVVPPTNVERVVVAQNSGRHLVSMRWGLVPFWSKDIKTGLTVFNAQSETILEKRSSVYRLAEAPMGNGPRRYRGPKRNGDNIVVRFADTNGIIEFHLPTSGVEHMCGRTLDDGELRLVIDGNNLTKLRRLFGVVHAKRGGYNTATCERGASYRRLDVDIVEIVDTEIKLSMDVFLMAARSGCVDVAGHVRATRKIWESYS